MQFKKNFFVAIATVLLSGSRVKAASADCEALQNALPYFNDEVKNAFNIDKCCDFNGVRCDADKNIIELRFNNLNKTNDFTGFIDKLATIKNLNYLDLAHNNIESNIPNSLCTITSLKNLNLAKNKLKGTIPYACKDLQNLEQVNLEGNKDLFGYVPVLNNVKGCAYKDTGLCDVSNSLCKNAPSTCTEDDIKKTNAENGNPDANSTTYEGEETKSRDMSLYDNYNGYSYGYSGYDQYNNYGGYDTSNYYGDNGYGYGNWGYDYGNGYDYSYYNNGYYGNDAYNDGYYGYDNSYYGYDNGYYYDPSGYDTSYYDNGYYNTGYTNTSYGNNGHSSGAISRTSGSVVALFIACLFSLFLF